MSLLLDAQAILNTSAKWCKHANARNAGGVWVSPEDPTAVAWDVYGALIKAWHAGSYHTSDFHAAYAHIQGKIAAPGPTTQQYFYVAGWTAAYDTVRVTRLKADGSVDTTWGTSGSVDTGSALVTFPQAISVDPSDNSIFVAGRGPFTGGDYTNYIIKLNPDGSINTGFGTSGTQTLVTGSSDNIFSIIFDGSGHLFVSVGNDISSDVATTSIVKLATSNGALVNAFGTSGVKSYTAPVGHPTSGAWFIDLLYDSAHSRLVALGWSPDNAPADGNGINHSGYLIGINPTTGAVDTTLGVSGVVDLGDTASNATGSVDSVGPRLSVDSSGNYLVPMQTRRSFQPTWAGMRRVSPSGVVDTTLGSGDGFSNGMPYTIWEYPPNYVDHPDGHAGAHLIFTDSSGHIFLIGGTSTTDTNKYRMVVSKYTSAGNLMTGFGTDYSAVGGPAHGVQVYDTADSPDFGADMAYTAFFNSTGNLVITGTGFDATDGDTGVLTIVVNPTTGALISQTPQGVPMLEPVFTTMVSITSGGSGHAQHNTDIEWYNDTLTYAQIPGLFT